MINNLSQTVFNKDFKVSSNSKTHKKLWFLKGVWCWFVQTAAYVIIKLDHYRWHLNSKRKSYFLRDIRLVFFSYFCLIQPSAIIRLMCPSSLPVHHPCHMRQRTDRWWCQVWARTAWYPLLVSGERTYQDRAHSLSESLSHADTQKLSLSSALRTNCVSADVSLWFMKADKRTGYSRITGRTDRLNIWSDLDLVIWDNAEEASAATAWNNLWCVMKIIETRHIVMINVSWSFPEVFTRFLPPAVICLKRKSK